MNDELTLADSRATEGDKMVRLSCHRQLKGCLGLTILLGFFTSFLTIGTLWSHCDNVNKKDNNFFRETADDDASHSDGEIHFHNRGAQSYNHIDMSQDEGPIDYRKMECLINDEYSIQCRREGNEVYIPFSFIHKYFEIYGKIEDYDGYERFEWQHSYSKVYPQGKYNPDGVFMSFEHYNVEIRDRVKCITASEGVPISTQWGPQGYHYPIQIAQFGLSHYSKHLTEDEPETVILEDGEDSELQSDWALPDKKSEVKLIDDPKKTSELNKVIEFKTSDNVKTKGVVMSIDESIRYLLCLDFKFANNGSIVINVASSDGEQQIRINYVHSDTVIAMEGKDIYYGLGPSDKKWHQITRDVSIDLIKGLALKYGKTKKNKLKLVYTRLVSIGFRGHGYVDNVALMTSAHVTHFYDAANWLLDHQDSRGGWPIMVQRKLIPDVLELPPGWYSAMAQGQAISLLIRAYLLSKNTDYLHSAINAIKIYEIDSSQGGVWTKFAGTYDWYEEYPTTPSSFVLNGFMYSLIGLYDLKTVIRNETGLPAKLFNAGMKTLKAMITLFDTGSGTVYDLRHFSLGTAPNLARWDYHTTHINQLLLLSTIDSDPIFRTTANRWIGYMKGRRAAHN